MKTHMHVDTQTYSPPHLPSPSTTQVRSCTLFWKLLTIQIEGSIFCDFVKETKT